MLSKTLALAAIALASIVAAAPASAVEYFTVDFTTAQGLTGNWDIGYDPGDGYGDGAVSSLSGTIDGLGVIFPDTDWEGADDQIPVGMGFAVGDSAGDQVDIVYVPGIPRDISPAPVLIAYQLIGTPLNVVFPSYFQATPGFLPTAVPEPASWTLMLIGFGAAGFGLRLYRRQEQLKLLDSNA